MLRPSKIRRSGWAALLLTVSLGLPLEAAEVVQTDVCVSGATAGGVAAAVQAGRMGKTVVLAEFGNHLGGMTSGGLGHRLRLDRMEPVFMILGQSAATATALAIDGERPVQQVHYEALRTRLMADGQVLEWTPPTKPPAAKPAQQCTKETRPPIRFRHVAVLCSSRIQLAEPSLC